MRFLIVGAGGTGGYFGGRLVEKGEDVTFLVRPERQKRLNHTGLKINSVHGDFHTQVETITSGEAADPFDVVLLSVKAYQLQKAIKDIAPYIGERTVILPLLNGYNHFSELRKAFGDEKVLGGFCFIETTLDKEGTIIQSSARHDLIFGEWNGTRTKRVERILQHLDHAGFTVVLSDNIQKGIWHKYIYIASMSGITTLMGTPIGPILSEPRGKDVYRKLLSEIVDIVKKSGAPISENIAARTMEVMESLHLTMKSSMQRDMEKQLPVETDHFHGALLALASPNDADYPILQTVYGRLKVYEHALKESTNE